MGSSRLPRRIQRFVGELRRRRVFRVLIAYSIVGVGAAEAAGIFLPAFGFPDWSANLVAVLVVLGLPVALGLAWAFDVVPDGDATGNPAQLGSSELSAPTAPSRAPSPTPSSSPSAPSSNPPEWSRVQEIFFQALERGEGEREAFLRSSTPGNERLREEVRSLLKAHGNRGALDDLEERVVAPLRSSGDPSEGQPGIPGVTDLEGTTLHQYEIQERLGGGGMGVVYRARDTRLGRTVALKFLSSHLLASREAKQRFLTEAQAAARLDHPNLCTIHEIGETEDGLLFIAMGYYEGETLKARLRQGRLPLDEALSITVQIARGLAHAAGAGIIHRDVKPANLVLTRDGTVKIVDFGVAKVLDDDVTRAGALVGTVAYMSPEQTRGDPVDQRTDVWSLGVVLYEMLVGERPFRGGSDPAVIHAILHEAPESVSEAAPDIPPTVAALVESMLQKDREGRPAGAAQVAERVEALQADPSALNTSLPSPTIPSEGERRLITVLACTIEGFDTLMDTMGMDQVDDRMRALKDQARAVVEDFGGVLNEFSEDGLVALFGVPVAHEDDGLRAVRAALQLHRSDPGQGTLELRAAVGSGQVAIQALDDPSRPYRVGGSVTREVTRLAAAAAPGEILVSQELVRVVAPFMETEARPPVETSPGAAPVSPVSVVGESDVGSRLDAAPQGGLTRFVGRGEEVRTLLNALGRVDGGTGLAVSVVGDAGVGKSRLLHEFRTTLAEDGIRYVQGRCQAQGGLTPFLPFIECIRAMLGMARTQPDQAHDQVISRTRALASDLEVYVPILLHILSIESDEFPLPDYLEGEDLRAAIAEALVSVFTLGCRGQPLVLFLEDWHWADGGSEDVLRQLMEMASAYPLLIVITSRPESEGYTLPPRGQIHLDLAPLDPDSAAEVMRATLRGARVSRELADLITEKTGGNPFFIEELSHTLLETEAVVLDGGEAVLAGASESLTIPDTVQAVLKTRIDRLDPESREVLRTASVIGRQFGRELLGRVVPSPSRLGGALDALRASGLIQRTTLVPEPTYRFKHALTLDVTYDSLLERQRRERHALVGEAMEELYEERRDEFADQLATHFAAAEQWDRAVHYGFISAERAASLWRTSEAMAALERTRTWIERRGAEREEAPDDMIRLLLAEERHLETLGRREDQAKLIRRLHTLVDDRVIPERAIVLVREGELATLNGDFVQAGEAFQEAMDVADACQAEKEHTMALRGIGHAYWRAGRYDLARPPLETVVARDRKRVQREDSGSARTTLLRDLINLGRVRRELGDWDEAQAIGAEARQLAEETGNPVDSVYACNYMGHLFRAMGRPEEALREFKAGSEGFSNAHLPVRHTFYLLAQAALELEMGKVDESMASYEDAIALSRRAGRADNLANALTLHAEALYSVGRPDEAVPLFSEAADILQGLGTDPALSPVLGKLALAAEAAGRPDAADHWAEARAVRDTLGDRAGVLEAAEREARLRSSRAPRRSRELYEIALEVAAEFEEHEVRARIINSLGLLDFREGAFESAVERFQSAARALRGGPAGDEIESPGLGTPEGLGVVLNAWGAALVRLGRAEEAVEVLAEALEANRNTKALAQQADALSTLGAALRAQRNYAAAYDRFEQCLELRQATEDRPGEGWALLRLAQVSTEADSPDRARKYAQAAKSMALELGDPELERLSGELLDTTGDLSHNAPSP